MIFFRFEYWRFSLCYCAERVHCTLWTGRLSSAIGCFALNIIACAGSWDRCTCRPTTWNRERLWPRRRFWRKPLSGGPNQEKSVRQRTNHRGREEEEPTPYEKSLVSYAALVRLVKRSRRSIWILALDGGAASEQDILGHVHVFVRVLFGSIHSSLSGGLARPRVWSAASASRWLHHVHCCWSGEAVLGVMRTSLDWTASLYALTLLGTGVTLLIIPHQELHWAAGHLSAAGVFFWENWSVIPYMTTKVGNGSSEWGIRDLDVLWWI